mgnify:CR=1 FL=1
MTQTQVAAIVSKAKARADQAIDYSPRYGAVCPECGKRMKIITSRPWEGGLKVRYHRCQNLSGQCLLAYWQMTVKSVQENH